MTRIDRFVLENPHFVVGREKAEEEIASGQLGFRLLGKVAFHECDLAAAELKQRYGILLQFDGKCLAAPDDAAEAEGYNAVMVEEFESRFGGNVIEDVFRDVARKLKKQRKRG
jgi:hypothetical protein